MRKVEILSLLFVLMIGCGNKNPPEQQVIPKSITEGKSPTSPAGKNEILKKRDFIDAYGYVIAQYISFKEENSGKPEDGLILRFNVFRWIQNISGNEMPSKDTEIKQLYPPNESHVPLSLQVESDDDLVQQAFLLRVVKKDGEIWAIPWERWMLGPKSKIEDLANREEQAFRDEIKPLRKIADIQARSEAFQRTAETTKSPSIILALESEPLQKYANTFPIEKADACRTALVRGLIALATRKNVPLIIRHYSIHEMDHPLPVDPVKNLAIQHENAERLVNAFHEVLLGARNPEMEYDILITFQWRLPLILKHPEWKDLAKKFQADLRVLKKKLDLDIVPREFKIEKPTDPSLEEQQARYNLHNVMSQWCEEWIKEIANVQS